MYFYIFIYIYAVNGFFLNLKLTVIAKAVKHFHPYRKLDNILYENFMVK